MFRLATFSKKNAQDYEYINSKPILKTIVDCAVLFFNIIFVLILLFNIFAYVLPKGSFFNFVSGDSMYPTLTSGQMVYTSNDLPLKRGDIIMSMFPDSEKLAKPEKADRNIIKRIIGLPGDYVDIYEDGGVYINGVELREPYLTDEAKSKTYIEGKTMHFELAKDEYMIMGDNRGNSNDSRYFGPIKTKDICYKQSVKPTSVTFKKTFILAALMCLIWFVYNLIEFILTELAYYVITKFAKKTESTKNTHQLKTIFESPEKQMHRTKEYLRRMNIANSNSDIKENNNTENKVDSEMQKD